MIQLKCKEEKRTQKFILFKEVIVTSKGFSREKYQKIIDLLLNSEKTFSEIAKETGSSPSHIKRINDGNVKIVRFAFKDTVFPIRESKSSTKK